MNSVSQVNNLAQFVRLVSEARTRNSAISSGIQKKQFAMQTPASKAFSQTRPVSTYSYSRQPASTQAAESQANIHQTRNLGTRFDAYA